LPSGLSANPLAQPFLLAVSVSPITNFMALSFILLRAIPYELFDASGVYCGFKIWLYEGLQTILSVLFLREWIAF
jgi:hypothetical protein